MINSAIVGIGFMGWIHWLAYQAAEGIRAAAIVSRDEKKRAGDWRGIKGNFGPPAGQVDLTGVKACESLDEVLADDSIDCVDICLPPHLHTEAALKSFAAGKHVFIEKPLALNVEDCDQMVAAAEASGKLLLVGHILPLLPEFHYAHAAVQDGRFGKLLGGSFKRVISDPDWIPDFYDPQKVGGPLLDLHIHDAHYIRLLFGMPRQVSTAGRMRGEVVQYANSLFRFDDPSLVVSSVGGVINQPGRSFTHAFEVHFEQATLLFDFAMLGDEPSALLPFTVLHSDGSIERPELGSGDPVDAFKLEAAEVAHCIAANRPSEILSGQLARDAIVLCQKEAESAKSGASVNM